MKYFWLYILLFLSFCAVLCYTCQPFPGPRDVDWQKEWKENETKLKKLTADILQHGNSRYTTGENSFPEEFSYPFDDGFSIESPIAPPINDTIDTGRVTITFFMDRGLLDHYQAIIFSNDPIQIKELEFQTVHGAADYKLEEGWYAIHD